MLLLILAVRADDIMYSCFENGIHRGICRSNNESLPTYNYFVYIDYTDMSFKVFANSTVEIFPSYTCKIYGWLTPTELTLECTSSKNTTVIPNIMYCSASKAISICVNE